MVCSRGMDVPDDDAIGISGILALLESVAG